MEKEFDPLEGVDIDDGPFPKALADPLWVTTQAGLGPDKMLITRRSVESITQSMTSNYNKAAILVEMINERKRQLGRENPGLSTVEVEIVARDDRTRKIMILDQQMYDRHTIRDASVLSAISDAVAAGLVVVR